MIVAWVFREHCRETAQGLRHRLVTNHMYGDLIALAMCLGKCCDEFFVAIERVAAIAGLVAIIGTYPGAAATQCTITEKFDNGSMLPLIGSNEVLTSQLGIGNSAIAHVGHPEREIG